MDICNDSKDQWVYGMNDEKMIYGCMEYLMYFFNSLNHSSDLLYD